jgi:hypothetical protein
MLAAAAAVRGMLFEMGRSWLLQPPLVLLLLLQAREYTAASVLPHVWPEAACVLQ